ncbi:hypothetical protein [Pandoraea communis]|uniref:hypothetical protein n=1 Tax=Pandoraea communis TaxID=2508297 RepID=UPI0025A58342|nr:hypothetical protein [Pandoraea communis]MDM8355308.1 hypothetical protein [Pandoraea communis]
MVLYTDSKYFIKLMDRSTPLSPNEGHPDGIGYERFREALYLTRQSTAPQKRSRSSARRAQAMQEASSTGH